MMKSILVSLSIFGLKNISISKFNINTYSFIKIQIDNEEKTRMFIVTFFFVSHKHSYYYSMHSQEGLKTAKKIQLENYYATY